MHMCAASPPHSVPSPGAMLCSMACNPGYLKDAACVVRGRHPHWTEVQVHIRMRQGVRRVTVWQSTSQGVGAAPPLSTLTPAHSLSRIPTADDPTANSGMLLGSIYTQVTQCVLCMLYMRPLMQTAMYMGAMAGVEGTDAQAEGPFYQIS